MIRDVSLKRCYFFSRKMRMNEKFKELGGIGRACWWEWGWGENVPQRWNNRRKDWGENRALYFLKDRKRAEMTGDDWRRNRMVEDEVRDHVRTWRTWKEIWILFQVQWNWQVWSQGVKWSIFKSLLGCWVINDPLYIVDLFYLFNSTHCNLKFMYLLV